MMRTDGELNALIRLLADDDNIILATVTARLLELGDTVVPALRDARTQAREPVRTRIDGILARLSKETRAALAWDEWHALTAGDEDIDLERGVAVLARFGYPDVDWAVYRQTLDQMAGELTIRLTGITDPVQIVQTMTDYLFREQGFQGASMDIPDTSYMNQVLDLKRGIPIALSAICLFLAHRLDLPIYGVGLPTHFIVKYQTADTELLFDPFSGGTILTRSACIEFVTRIGHRFTEAYLDPVPDRYILARMLNNLIMIYSNLGEQAKAKRLLEYRRLVLGERV